jgi:solute carrier family 38 (sodium-coupled neutral amino acid transporter), member 11
VKAIVPAVVLVGVMGTLSGYCFSLIARSCAMNKVDTYMEAWEKTLGSVVILPAGGGSSRVFIHPPFPPHPRYGSPKTAWMVAGACTFKTFCACLAYSIIIGDSFSSLLGSMGP